MSKGRKPVRVIRISDVTWKKLLRLKYKKGESITWEVVLVNLLKK